MKRIFFSALAILLSLAIYSQDQLDNSSLADANVFPIITFEQDTIDLGNVRQGESVSAQFKFVNSGPKALDIEIVTACKCTSISWPQEPVAANGLGSIFVTFDSTDYEGEVFKVVDIIANTDPIVVEAFFKVNVITED